MKTFIPFIAFMFIGLKAGAQVFYMDPKTFTAVIENQFMRLSYESMHISNTANIKEKMDNINTNVAKIVLIRNQIYNSLVNVNEALKSGKEMKFIIKIVKEISDECVELGEMAVGNPLYVAFAENCARNAMTQSISIFNDINQMILKEGGGLLMDYNSRDFLLRNLTRRLQLLRAEIYMANQTIYYAKLNGFWTTLNPFKDIINSDRMIIKEIINRSKLLK